MSNCILVIEDNHTNLELIAYLLKAYGNEVLTALDGRTGLDLAQQRVPDLIICDIQMPGIDGYEVARRLRNTPSLAKVPLVAVTALAMVDDRRKVIEGGFDGYISEPIEPQTFIDQIQPFLRKPAPAAPAQTPTQTAPAAESGAVPATSPPPRHTILVVDDSRDNREFARNLLEPSGYRVNVATNVATALALVREAPPDLILSDLHMPGGSGFELVETLKADRKLRDIPFVFLSCTVWSDSDQRTGLERGADRFLIRPMELQSLLDEIAGLLAARGS